MSSKYSSSFRADRSTLDEIRSKIDFAQLVGETVELKPQGKSFIGLCPFHDDNNPSFSVDPAKGFFKCFACDAKGDVFKWVELTDKCKFSSALMKLAARAGVELPRSSAGTGTERKTPKKLIATYDYVDEHDDLRFQVLRYEPKTFKQRRPDGKDGWIWNLEGVDKILFRLPEVIKGVETGVGIWITEGEKDAVKLVEAGVCATSAAGGAGAPWLDEYTQTLEKANDVTIVADNDKHGYERAQRVRDELDAAGVLVRVVRAKAGKDAADHLAAAYGIEDFVYLSFSQLNALVASKTGTVTECYPSKGNGVTEIDASTSSVTPVTDVTLTTYEAKPDPSNILNRIETFVRRYCILPSESCYAAVALWAAHTWIFHKFEVTPRLVLPSPEKGSGKTRVLECLGNICSNPIQTINISPAALFRIIEQDGPTILMDEVDTIFVGTNPGDSQEALRGIFNAGYKQGAKVQRCINFGESVAEFAVFAPAALAGIGNLPDTIMDRAVIIRMRKRSIGEHVEPYRIRTAKVETHQLRIDIERWAKSLEKVDPYDSEVPLPDGIRDRLAEVWEPLIWIASLAGEEWLERAQIAAVELAGAAKAHRDEGLGHQLLLDIRQVFEDSGTDRIPTKMLVLRLIAMEESPWASFEYGRSLNSRQLAQMLKAYEISSRTIRVGSTTAKGYEKEKFYDAWNRYLPAPEIPYVKSVTEVTGVTSHVDGIKECYPVTHQKVTSLFELIEGSESSSSATDSLPNSG